MEKAREKISLLTTLCFHGHNCVTQQLASVNKLMHALPSLEASPDPLYSFGGFINGSVIISTVTVVVTPSIGTINVRCQCLSVMNNATDVQSVQAVFMGKYCS